MQGASEKLGTVEARQSPPEPPPEPPIVVPDILRWLYGTVEYVPTAIVPGKNSIAVVGDRLPKTEDLTTFIDNYQEQDATGATFSIKSVDGVPPDLGELPDEK